MGGEILELYSERMARFEKEATAKGLAKGISQGMAQGISQVIANMLNLNMPFETISAATGYSHEQILNISKTLQAN